MGPPSALDEFGEWDMRKNFSAVGFSAVGMPEPKSRLRRKVQDQEGREKCYGTYRTMVNRGATTDPYCALFAPPVTLPFVEGETDRRYLSALAHSGRLHTALTAQEP